MPPPSRVLLPPPRIKQPPQLHQPPTQPVFSGQQREPLFAEKPLTFAEELQQIARAAAEAAEAKYGNVSDPDPDPREAVRGHLLQEIQSRPALAKSQKLNANGEEEGPAIHPFVNELQQIKGFLK